MAVLRRENWVSQQRVDIPAMRSLESAVSNDFDQLIESFVTGTTQGYILRGFALSMAGAIGGAASGLQMIVDPGAIFHVTSGTSGTFYLVPTGTSAQQLNSATNTIVNGAFVPNAINYVGLDYLRSVDDTTDAQDYIWDPTQNIETTLNAPQAQILTYTIQITTGSFATTTLPVATVTTDSGNNVVSITDARWMLFRLATGGASPNPFYVYPWTAQTEGRTENPSTSTSNSINPFEGGDKMLMTLKDWMNAIMSSLLEMKGTTYWYSYNGGGSIIKLREDLANTVTTGIGTITHSQYTAGLITWSNPIFMKVVGSTLSYEIAANPSTTDITLADDEVAYINLIRDVPIVPNLIFINSSTLVASVGSVVWTTNLVAGDYIRLSSDPDADYYEIANVVNLYSVNLTTPFTETSTGASGATAVYSYGSYATSSVAATAARSIQVSTRETVPTGQNIFWLFLRADNGGGIPTAYIHFLGVQLQQGESEEIDSDVPVSLLNYVGTSMPGLNSNLGPQYAASLGTIPTPVPQVTQIILGSAASMSPSQYFYINSSANAVQYYVWFKINGVGTDPAPSAYKVGLEVDVPAGYTNVQVASLVATALNNTLNFRAVINSNPNQNILTVTNTSAGTTNAASNVDVSSPFAINTQYTFSVTAANATAGAVYTNNGSNFTVVNTIAAATTLVAWGSGAPTSSGTLTKSSGTGDATITFSSSTTGTGEGNYYIHDGDNLTLAIKELDTVVGELIASLDDPSYDEFVNVVASGAVPPGTITGPISSGTDISLPLNSRLGNIVQNYTVGAGKLMIDLNGQELGLNYDYLEVGTAGTASNTIQILQNLVVGDNLHFRILGGGGGGGGGGIGPAGPQGPAGPAGADAAGGPVAISTKTSSYAVLTTDNALLANCASGAITFTLPTPSAAVGHIWYFKKIDSTSNSMTLVVSGGGNIDGASSISTMTQYSAFTLFTDGSAYWIF